jgi:xanthine dehydrogenase accessory factor
MRIRILESLLAARAAGRPVVLLTRLDGGGEALLDGDRVEGDLAPDEALHAAAREALRTDRSRIEDSPTHGRCFVAAFNPPLRMFIVGAVHITQALAPMASLAGYRVTVIDPRRAFATQARFPGIEVLGDWPDEALERLAPDRRSAVVTLTHDPKLDDPALRIALASEAFYVGALGSRRTHAARLERLAAAGLAPEQTARVRGPAGLAIGARTPAEIAVAVLAEATWALRGDVPP